MTAFVDAPVPKNPAPIPNGGDILRFPSAELPEVLSNLDGARRAAAANETETGPVEDPFKLTPKFAYTPKKLKVFTIGAGFSGLLMAHKFQHRFPDMRDIVDHTIFEARSDVGGTWLANDYPGVQCDVPAHIYVSTDQIIPANLDVTRIINIMGRHFHLIPTPIGVDFTPAVQIFCST